MEDYGPTAVGSPPEQQAISANCFLAGGAFSLFPKEEIDQSIPDRFEKMVRRHGERLAVKTDIHSYTYKELNRRANRVARAILAERRDVNEPLAILVEQGAPSIVALLGALKAGTFYVMLDASHPGARLKYVLRDSQAAMIVTDDNNIFLARRLAEYSARLLNIDKSDSIKTDENPALVIPPDRLAYIMYTSGSTGQPKGVTQNHRNLLHMTRCYTNQIHLSPEDRLTLLHSCSSGSAQYHLFGSLLNGAAVYPFDSKGVGVTAVIRWLLREEISVFHSFPAFFHNFVNALDGTEAFPSLRLIHLSAAPAAKKDLEFYKKYLSRHAICVHSMGSTEATLIRWYFIDAQAEISGNRIPVGYPVDDKEIILLDDNGESVGFERVGEIAIKSRYLSPGYWRKPELTRAKFMPNPEGGDQRIYRTGDLGLMASDGCLFHLGREDFQVKVRGYRVEVGEVEAALMECAAIREVAVVGREVQSGDRRLVAYFVPAGAPAATVTDLRQFLKDRIPDYMIPSVFVRLSALPLTPNGKVDRLALPPVKDTRPELHTPFVASKTPVQKELAEIWAEVLSLDRVGIDDNFFDLGGHSLAATRVVSQVIRKFQLELPHQALFRSPTIAEMAEVITRSQAKKIDEGDLNEILAELESISDEQAQQIVGDDVQFDIEGKRR